MELFSIISLFLAVFVARQYAYLLEPYLDQLLDFDVKYIQLMSYGIAFVVVVIGVSMLAKFITMLVRFAALGFVNRALGALFGALKYLIIVCFILVLFDQVNTKARFVKIEVLSESVLYKPLKEFSVKLYPSFIDQLSKQKETIEKVKEEIM